jgi:hypothetical protein
VKERALILLATEAAEKVVIHLDDDAPVRTGPRTFRKRLLRPGKWAHTAAPGGVLNVDAAYMQALADNFSAGVWDTVHVPFGHPKDEKDAVLSNAGQVTALEVGEDGLYGILDIDPAHADKIGSLVKGVSCGILPDYTDHEVDGRGNVGPVLAHVALTNEPYIKGLGDFTPVSDVHLAEAQADGTLLTPIPEEPKTMKLDEIKALLKSEHDIDLDALTAAPASVDEAAITTAATENVVAALGEALVGAQVITLAEGVKPTLADVVGAIKGVAEEGRKATVELAETKADAAVSAAIRDGRILPAKAATFKALFLSDPATFEALTDTKVVDFSEVGTVGVELTEPSTGETIKTADEIDRLSTLAATLS